jgi:carbohydrate kinase (thermoresistant glucokinase family)
VTGIVVMGVSAAGKSSVARALSQRLNVPWADADAFHPAANIAKMAAGTPLNDEDRWPWLDLVGEKLASERRVVIACSALRRVYRDRLRAARPDTVFVHLHADWPVLASRAASREDHFMPPALLQSQLATLEPLAVDEKGVVVDVAPRLTEVVDRATEWISQNV